MKKNISLFLGFDTVSKISHDININFPVTKIKFTLYMGFNATNDDDIVALSSSLVNNDIGYFVSFNPANGSSAQISSSEYELDTPQTIQGTYDFTLMTGGILRQLNVDLYLHCEFFG